MNHPTELALMLYADQTLHNKPDRNGPEAVAIDQHLDTCPACRRAVAALSRETHVLSQALSLEVAATPAGKVRFRQPSPWREATLTTFVAAGITALVQWGWKALFEEAALASVAWAASTWMPSVYSLANDVFLFFQHKGADMFDNYLALILGLALLVPLVALVKARPKSNILPTLLMALVTGTALLGIAPSGHALQIITEEHTVIIEAEETIDDTVLIAARDVTVHGKVNGNLLVAAEDIAVTGVVDGNLIVFADDIEISGSIQGMTVSAADSLEFNGASLGSDLWLAGDSIELDEQTQIAGNLSTASSALTLASSVTKDVYSAADRLVIKGHVAGDVEAVARHIELADTASIGGNLQYRSSNQEELVVDENASVAGDVAYKGEPKGSGMRHHFDFYDFYLWKLLWFVAAFIVGWIAITLIPRLGDVQLQSGVAGLKTAGIGLLALVSAPVMAIVVGITLVGLPLSFITIACWLVAWYLSQIVLAYYIGRSIIEKRHDRPGLAVALLLGLLIVTLATSLPLLGGVLALLATILGLGLMVELWLNRDSITGTLQ